MHEPYFTLQNVNIPTEEDQWLGSVGKELVDAGNMPLRNEEEMLDLPDTVGIKHETYAQEADPVSWFDSNADTRVSWSCEEDSLKFID